ncbi:MAG TPA: GAF domain-containing sensor histidine kinase [Ktedonobacterales bacterium]
MSETPTQPGRRASARGSASDTHRSADARGSRPARSGPNGRDESAAKLLRRNRELAILNAIAGALNRSLDVSAGLREALALVGELLGLRAGWVWLLDDAGEPHLAAAQALPPYLADTRYPERMSGSCYCLSTFVKGDLRGAANVNIVECSRLWEAHHQPGHAAEAEGLRYHASIPLHAGAKKLGVMNVASTDWRRLEPDELQLLATIGDQVGLAVERAQLSAEATRAAARLATAEERNRLAREIHDTLAQNLAGIALYLEAAEQAMPTSEGRAREGVRRALELARIGLRESRRSVADLRAAPLRDRTLPEALGELATQTAREARFDVNYTPPESFPRLSASVEVGIYRIAQEALTNVARHADARHAALALERGDGEVRLLVCDDGRGFDPERLGQTGGRAAGVGGAGGEGHFGLIGMGERARLLGTTLSVESAPGEGTRVEVRVPLR